MLAAPQSGISRKCLPSRVFWIRGFWGEFNDAIMYIIFLGLHFMSNASAPHATLS